MNVSYKRCVKFFFQRLIHDFDDSETWALDSTIAKFALPRLKRFKEISIATPLECSDQEWDQIVNELIWLCEQYETGDVYDLSPEDDARLNEACTLLGKYFRNLWW